MLSNAYCTSTCVFPSSPIHDTGSSLESHLSSLSSELTADMCQIFTTNGGNDETGQAKMRGMGASYCASSSTATMPKNALHGYNYDDRVALWYRRTQPVLTPYLGKHGQFGQLSSGPARSKNQWANRSPAVIGSCDSHGTYVNSAHLRHLLPQNSVGFSLTCY